MEKLVLRVELEFTRLTARGFPPRIHGPLARRTATGSFLEFRKILVLITQDLAEEFRAGQPLD